MQGTHLINIYFGESTRWCIRYVHMPCLHGRPKYDRDIVFIPYSTIQLNDYVEGKIRWSFKALKYKEGGIYSEVLRQVREKAGLLPFPLDSTPALFFQTTGN